MKVVCISDTHDREFPDVPDGDVLIHCGDFSGGNMSIYSLAILTEWFKTLPHKHKILVPGNHDWCFEEDYENSLKVVGDVATVLVDQEVVIDGVKFYGTPFQPRFFDWAFNVNASVRKQKFEAIPEDTDVLITHTPPYERLDLVSRGLVNAGCPILLENVKRVKPKFHVFGHIHEGAGVDDKEETTFINCAICDGRYDPVNSPITFEIKGENDGI